MGAGHTGTGQEGVRNDGGDESPAIERQRAHLADRVYRREKAGWQGTPAARE